jgi:dephospho-CoA kinase
MLVIGLTGSAAMGKSTVARMFADAGAAIFDADLAVHRLYAGPAIAAIGAAFPSVVVDNVVDRGRLGELAFADPAVLKRLEAIVHPLVRAEEEKLRRAAAAAGRDVFVLDIPLLLETGGEGRVDVVVVVSAPAAVQEARLMGRPGMTMERIAALRARQMPDEEKRRRAHFIVDTSGELDQTRRQVGDILRAVAATAAGR